MYFDDDIREKLKPYKDANDKTIDNYPALRTSAQLDESLHIISDHPLNSHQDNVTAD